MNPPKFSRRDKMNLTINRDVPQTLTVKQHMSRDDDVVGSSRLRIPLTGSVTQLKSRRREKDEA